MIIASGYSKDPSIIPEGIAVTFGRQMIEEQGGLKTFLTVFQETMDLHEEGNYWMHTCSNLPTLEVDHIYIIVSNRLYGRVYCGGFYRKPSPSIIGYGATGKQKLMDKPFVILSGPFEKCPHKRALKGFQGFGYTTKLF